MRTLKPISNTWLFGSMSVFHNRVAAWMAFLGSDDATHLLKCMLWALRPGVRTVHFGRVGVDMTGALDYGMPPWLLKGRDRQSHREMALALKFLTITGGDYRVCGARLMCIHMSLISVDWQSKELDLGYRSSYL